MIVVVAGLTALGVMTSSMVSAVNSDDAKLAIGSTALGVIGTVIGAYRRYMLHLVESGRVPRTACAPLACSRTCRRLIRCGIPKSRLRRSSVSTPTCPLLRVARAS